MRWKPLKATTTNFALGACAVALLFSPHLPANRATPVQDPNATLPSSKKGSSAKKTAPAKKISTKPPSERKTGTTGSSCSAKSPTQATGRTRTVTLRNGAMMELVEIPAGSFCMGSTIGKADEDEKPVHHVTISYPFYMGKYEVTQAQWQAVMGNNPSYFEDCGNCPVEQVSWNDAQEFISKSNEANDGFKYRLASEAEWEYACRAGTTGDYAGNLEAMAWYYANSGDARLTGPWVGERMVANKNRTHAAGSKMPNAFGLFDMHGNVKEWCEDWRHKTYDGAPTDVSAWLSGGEQMYRVERGGSWEDFPSDLRSANSSGDVPNFRNGSIGFRVVAVVRAR